MARLSARFETMARDLPVMARRSGAEVVRDGVSEAYEFFDYETGDHVVVVRVPVVRLEESES